jgi:predicted nucleic acid-binding protein
MTGAECFIDTNILFCAFDLESGNKRLRALDALDRFERQGDAPCTSVQVLNELFISLSRKGRLDAPEARAIVERLMAWRVVSLTARTTAIAFKEMERWKISWWDALILAAARQTGVHELWREDFNDGQDYDGIRVVNPLRGGRKK